MMEKREFCTCSNCGNEAEMIVSCEWVDIDKSVSDRTARKNHQKAAEVCTLCGNEANMLIGHQS